jgi:hypothetical protein
MMCMCYLRPIKRSRKSKGLLSFVFMMREDDEQDAAEATGDVLLLLVTSYPTCTRRQDGRYLVASPSGKGDARALASWMRASCRTTFAPSSANLLPPETSTEALVLREAGSPNS